MRDPSGVMPLQHEPCRTSGSYRRDAPGIARPSVRRGVMPEVACLRVRGGISWVGKKVLADRTAEVRLTCRPTRDAHAIHEISSDSKSDRAAVSAVVVVSQEAVGPSPVYGHAMWSRRTAACADKCRVRKVGTSRQIGKAACTV